MLERLYQVIIGNLQQSWVAGWRAISVAQLTGFHQPDNQTLYKALNPKTKYDPQIMWLHIIILDCQVGSSLTCLMAVLTIVWAPRPIL